MKKINLIYMIIALGGFLQGYLTSIIAGMLPFMAKEFNLTPTTEGLVSSIILFGGIVGALMGGKISDYIGRRKALFMFEMICTVGVIGSSFASSITAILIFRFIMGMSIGAVTGLVPIYLSELSPSDIRGKVTSYNTVFCNFGVFIAYVVNYALFDTGNWRLMNLLFLVISVILLFGFFIIPESPQWLLNKGKYEEAREVSLIMFNREDALTEHEKEAIEQEEKELPQPKLTFQSWMKRPLLLCVYVVVFQKLTGSSSVLYYAPRMFESAGLASKFASLSTIGIGLLIFIFTFVCNRIIDIKGRKTLLLFGNMVMGVTLLAMGFLTKMSSNSGIILVLLMFVFIAAFGLTWGAVPWTLLGEMLPRAIKGTGSSIATGSSWFADAMLALSFPTLLKLLHIDNIFLIYGVLNILSYIFLKAVLHETKGKTQYEIEEMDKQIWEAKHSKA